MENQHQERIQLCITELVSNDLDLHILDGHISSFGDAIHDILNLKIRSNSVIENIDSIIDILNNKQDIREILGLRDNLLVLLYRIDKIRQKFEEVQPNNHLPIKVRRSLHRVVADLEKICNE